MDCSKTSDYFPRYVLDQRDPSILPYKFIKKYIKGMTINGVLKQLITGNFLDKIHFERFKDAIPIQQ
jgi:hypothetical protein